MSDKKKEKAKKQDAKVAPEAGVKEAPKKTSQEGPKKEAPEESKEVDVLLDDVKMQEDEELRIVVTKTTDGSLTLNIKSKGNVNDVSFFEVVGLLTTAQGDLMRQNQSPQQQPQQQQQMVNITLQEEDFDLDQDGRLKQSGKKVGDVLQVPAQIAELREMSIAQMNARKAQGGASHMSVEQGGVDS